MDKRWVGGLLLLLLLLLGLCPALADEGVLTFQDRVSAPADAEEIDFGDYRVRDLTALIDYLGQFPNLKRVDMFATPVQAPEIDRLAAAFPNVEFGWTMRLSCYNPVHPDRKYHEIRTDATAFSTLHNNQCFGHTSEDFRILQYCKSMLALDLGHNRLTDLDFLYAMPKLRVLIVAINDVRDATPVTALTDLEYLEIFTNHLTDLSGFENLTNLMDLNICFNNITDYSPLYHLPKLQRLWLYNSNDYNSGNPVPEEVVDTFRQLYPGLQMNTRYYPTLAGWRTYDDRDNIPENRVPHYAVIYKMFMNGVYIPFEESAPLE